MRVSTRLVGSLLLVCLVPAACHRESPAQRAKTDRARRQIPVAPVALPRAETLPPLVGPDGTDEAGYPRRHVNPAYLRRLLSDRRYDTLTRELEQLQAAFEADARKELWPIEAARAFWTAVPELDAQLDAWVAASPQSFAPWLARGAHRVGVGFNHRGSATADRTHRDNFAAMEAVHRQAGDDLARALELRPRLLAARVLQLKIASAAGRRLDEIVEGGLSICADCIGFYHEYMTSLLPRWGGSYPRLLAAAIRAPVGKNPRLRVLRGYVDYDEARILAANEGDRERALERIQRACALGEHWLFLDERAQIEAQLGQQDAARRDSERAAELEPTRAEVRFHRGRILLASKEYEGAGRELVAGLHLDATDEEGRELLPSVKQGLIYAGWEQHKAGHRDVALRLLDLAVELDPDDKALQGRRTFILSDGKHRAETVEITELQTKARGAPDDFRAQQELDYALAKQGRFAEIIDLWTTYLGRHPDDARAYLERGGAAWRLGRRAEARANAKQSCDLGLAEACQRLQKLPL
jgi:tetratricopeptide (TPR) repeat protein